MEIRPITVDDIPQYAHIMSHSFGRGAPREVTPEQIAEHTRIGAYESRRLQAALTIIDFEMFFGSERRPCGGIASVGCEPAARKLIPYVIPDENVTPGVATYYATTCAECEAGCGIVAKVREGRVINLAVPNRSSRHARRARRSRGAGVSEFGGRQPAELAEQAGCVRTASSPSSTATTFTRPTSASEEDT